MKRVRILAVAVLGVCSVLPTANDARAERDDREYRIVNPPLDPIDVGDGFSTVLQGELGEAGYIVEVPPTWNGELVMWAHGYRGTGTVLTVDPPGYGLREHLLEHGYAWAASSYETNGYDVESGVRSTRDLARHFRRLVDRPDRIYLAGVSMGGHVTARSIEQYPSFYDGAMPLCGVVGDVELFDYFIDFTFTAQALAGDGFRTYPIPADYGTRVVPSIEAALGTTGFNLDPPLTEAGEQFRSIVIEQSGGPRPGGEVAFGYWENFLFGLAVADDGGILALNPGRVGTNVGTDYEPDEPLPIDDTVLRVGPVDARARRSRALGPIPLIDGRIRVPVLTLHDLGDLFVPFSMEQYYAEDVADRGRSELLVQRAIRAVGHCEFSEPEVTTAFDDLVTWVEDGVRPAGDDVLDPATVADPEYGCTFTDPTAYGAGTFPDNTRPLFPPC